MLSVKLFPSATDAGNEPLEIDFTEDGFRALLEADAAKVGTRVSREFDGDRLDVVPLTKTNRSKLGLIAAGLQTRMESSSAAIKIPTPAGNKKEVDVPTLSGDTILKILTIDSPTTPAPAYLKLIWALTQFDVESNNFTYKYLYWVG